jgi:hypothetical protein
VSDFYLACELKLNSIADDDETNALTIIIQLDDLWTKIDRVDDSRSLERPQPDYAY